KFKMFEGFSASVTIAYRRCERDGVTVYTKRPYTPARILPAWKVAMASDPLVALEVRGEVPITIVVSIWFPGAASFLKRLGEILGVEAKFYVSVKLEFGIEVSIGQDQYEGFADETGVSLSLPITFEVGVVLEV